MMFDPSIIQVFQWPHLLGFHVNIALDRMTPELAIARVHPTSPECVWSGDAGRPATVPVYDEFGDKVGSQPNPDGAKPYDATAFLLFVDEAEARLMLARYMVEA